MGGVLLVCMLYLFCFLLTFSDINDSLNDSEIKWIATQVFGSLSPSFIFLNINISFFIKITEFLLYTVPDRSESSPSS